jgi:hypothetical protein
MLLFELAFDTQFLDSALLRKPAQIFAGRRSPLPFKKSPAKAGPATFLLAMDHS